MYNSQKQTQFLWAHFSTIGVIQIIKIVSSNAAVSINLDVKAKCLDGYQFDGIVWNLYIYTYMCTYIYNIIYIYL